MIRINRNAAELVGVVLGDGNMYHLENCFEMRVTLNSNEIDYAEKISDIVEEVVFVRPRIRFRRDSNAIDVRLQTRRAVEKIFILGLDYGGRTSKQTGIPSWIFSREEFLRSCVRGLIDTDGSLYKLTPHWPNLSQLSFKSSNRKLLVDAREALVILGFRPSKIFGNRIVVTRQDDIAKYFKEVGTSNSKYSPVV